ncbi:RNA polymerase sigma factor [Sphaerisporangium fuscum]|uniref:RNA polymerase sigma factor n=1 Tax=Sphaerisporangium fuscum TaxID=2835868 RepID=UPI001BDDBA94|nr:RNA polymerase sigma factor [Sphaerisporangium fuscum]
MAAVTQALPTEEVSDAAIIEQSWRDPERFAAVFDRYYFQIHGFAAQRLGPSLADDVAAETFLIAFDRRERYDLAREDARPWLYGIVANLIARHHRTEARRYRALSRAPLGGTDEGHAEQVAGRVDAEALRGPLMAALAKITDAHRDVLLLVAWAGLSCEEAAEALGVPPATARTRLHRARKKIRAALDRAATTPGTGTGTGTGNATATGTGATTGTGTAHGTGATTTGKDR